MCSKTMLKEKTMNLLEIDFQLGLARSEGTQWIDEFLIEKEFMENLDSYSINALDEKRFDVFLYLMKFYDTRHSWITPMDYAVLKNDQEMQTYLESVNVVSRIMTPETLDVEAKSTPETQIESQSPQITQC